MIKYVQLHAASADPPSFSTSGAALTPGAPGEGAAGPFPHSSTGFAGTLNPLGSFSLCHGFYGNIWFGKWDRKRVRR